MHAARNAHLRHVPSIFSEGGQGYEAGILLCARFNLTLSASREGRAATEILVDGFQLS